MLKKYVAKFTVDILPSVAATVIGAYIVNHYIVTKPARRSGRCRGIERDTRFRQTRRQDPANKTPAKPETSSDAANAREPGVKAKGISEKAMFEKTAAEKPAENVTEKPTETAGIPADPRRQPPALREKAAARIVTAPAAPAAAGRGGQFGSAGRSRRRAGRTPRRQRSGARGDRAPAQRQ